MQAGNFFPPEYKEFSFREGDLLVSRRSDGRFAVNKILKVDRFDLKAGSSISIQNQVFTATEDDFLLVVSTAYGAAEFGSAEEAREAAKSGKWTVEVGHVPNRTPGASAGQEWAANQPVTQSELSGYDYWRAAFDRGEAGIF